MLFNPNKTTKRDEDMEAARQDARDEHVTFKGLSELYTHKY